MKEKRLTVSGDFPEFVVTNKLDVGGETVRVFGRPEELAEHLEASGYDIPANEIQPD